jgi:hypothetical protein
MSIIGNLVPQSWIVYDVGGARSVVSRVLLRVRLRAKNDTSAVRTDSANEILN